MNRAVARPHFSKANIMAKGKGNALATAKARVAKLEAADKRKKAVASATADLKRAQANLKAARGTGKKKG